jgi:hypothetical protein
VTTDELTSSASAIQALSGKLRDLHTTLPAEEQRLLQALVVAACVPQLGDVQGYGLGWWEARQTAIAAAVALGLAVVSMGVPTSGTAQAAPLDQTFHNQQATQPAAPQGRLPSQPTTPRTTGLPSQPMMPQTTGLPGSPLAGPQQPGPIFVYDLSTQLLQTLPLVDESLPSLSSDGGQIVFTTFPRP